MGNFAGIDVFVRVVQAGSFSAAAKLLDMPVTTVSGKIAALEKRLGITLIHRTTRRLSITQAGQNYFQHCVRALDEMTAAEKELFASKLEPEGRLRLTAAPDIGHLVLPPLIRKFLSLYPKVQVELILTNRFVDLVSEGVDLAIRVGNLKDSSLIARKFRDVQIGLWASQTYAKKYPLPKTPSDLKEHAIVAFGTMSTHLTLSKNGKSMEVPIEPRIIVDDMEAVKNFVSGGDGIGVLSSLICEPEIASSKLVQVLPQWELQLDNSSICQISFVYPPQRFVPLKVQAFIELALKSDS